MARMNPKRRAIARLKAELTAQHIAKVRANTEPLQGGNVRSVLTRFDNRIGSLKPPRESWEGTGKAGKIVDGKFKPTKPGSRQRFAKS